MLVICYFFRVTRTKDLVIPKSQEGDVRMVSITERCPPFLREEGPFMGKYPKVHLVDQFANYSNY